LVIGYNLQQVRWYVTKIRSISYPATDGGAFLVLARAEPGAVLEYHRGLLVRDRSPASDLSEDERRTLAKIADAALTAAADGLAHLVQYRNGPFDFSYVAIKAAPARSKRIPRSLSSAGVDDLPAAA
jgi:hypothetical protein